MSGWPAPRRHLAAIAVAGAIITAGVGAALGGIGWATTTAVLYGVVAVAGLVVPAAITVQVLLGTVLVALLLLDPGGLSWLLVVPIVAGVVLTAELLGAVARMDSPVVPAASHDDLRGAGIAVAIAAGAFAVVMMAGALQGPSGLVAVIIATAACAGVGAMVAPR